MVCRILKWCLEVWIGGSWAWISTLVLIWNILSYFQTASLNFGWVCHCLLQRINSLNCHFPIWFTFLWNLPHIQIFSKQHDLMKHAPRYLDLHIYMHPYPFLFSKNSERDGGGVEVKSWSQYSLERFWPEGSLAII